MLVNNSCVCKINWLERHYKFKIKGSWNQTIPHSEIWIIKNCLIALHCYYYVCLMPVISSKITDMEYKWQLVNRHAAGASDVLVEFSILAVWYDVFLFFFLIWHISLTRFVPHHQESIRHFTRDSFHPFFSLSDISSTHYKLLHSHHTLVYRDGEFHWKSNPKMYEG